MPLFKVLISDAVSDVCRLILEERDIKVDHKPGLPANQLLTTIPDYHGLIVRSATKVTAEVIHHAKNLKVVGRAGTGIDNIDVNAATEKGIAVLNCLGANTISAAEHTFALMMALARQIPAAHSSMRDGKWQRSDFKGVELYDKVYGIIGLGKIGLEIAKRAQAFGMTVIAFDPLVESEIFNAAGVEPCDFDDLFKRSDFVSVHVPLIPDTKHFIGEAQFQMCQPSLRLINTSRGGVVDEQALFDALQTGKIAGAALDVFENEPPVDSPLIGLKNVITTPHLAASTFEAQERVAVQIAEQVADYLFNRRAVIVELV